MACAAGPILPRFTVAPRWLFSRLAVLVTAVLLVPDAWLLVKGQSPQAIIVLVAMHLAMALVTYNALIHVAVLQLHVASHRSKSPTPRTVA